MIVRAATPTTDDENPAGTEKTITISASGAICTARASESTGSMQRIDQELLDIRHESERRHACGKDHQSDGCQHPELDMAGQKRR